MTHLKTLATGAVLAALAIPTVMAQAADTTPSASSQCKALKTSMGATTFKNAYGTNADHSNAFGKCVSKIAKAQKANLTNASKQCDAEQAANPALFTSTYGTGKKGANAHGRCVSTKAKAADAKTKSAELNAARACKTEQAAGKAAFVAKYGKNGNKRNAFGKCVSSKTKPVPATTA